MRDLDTHFSSASVEWYTPAEHIERAVRCLEHIDLDPAADPGKRVPALNHCTKEDDGLSQQWHGRVFLNPPYGKEGRLWVAKLKTHYDAGHVEEAILLVPARTDTLWFKTLWSAGALCFVRGRIAFEHPDGPAQMAPFPSVYAYFGPRTRRFCGHYAAIGQVIRP